MFFFVCNFVIICQNGHLELQVTCCKDPV